MQYTYELEIEPVVSNNAYVTDYKSKRRFLKPELRKWKDEFIDKMKQYDISNERDVVFSTDKSALQLSLTLVFYLSYDKMYYKNGKLKKKDTSGMIKLAEDAVSEYTGIDDSYNFDVCAYKRLSNDNKSVVVVKISDKIIKV